MSRLQSFIRTPDPVTAIQYTKDVNSREAITVWVTNQGYLNYVSYSTVIPDRLFIETRSGLTEVSVGNWVVLEKGYFSVLSDKEFKSLFTPLDNNAP